MTSDDTQAGSNSLTVRNIGQVFTDDEDIVVIDHLYETGSPPCDDCGSPCTDTGLVGLMIDSGDNCVLLDPGQALLLANRLQRAAGLALETREDAPDLSREAALLGGTSASAREA